MVVDGGGNISDSFVGVGVETVEERCDGGSLLPPPPPPPKKLAMLVRLRLLMLSRTVLVGRESAPRDPMPPLRAGGGGDGDGAALVLALGP